MIWLSSAFWLQVLLAIFIFLPTSTPFTLDHNTIVRDGTTAVRKYAPYAKSWFSRCAHLHGRSPLALPMAVDSSDDTGSVQEFGSHQRDPMWQERAKRWIIIVDDEEPIRQAVGQLLFDRGYQVTACADGPTALKVARSKRAQDGVDQPAALPDVLVCDIRMPGMDGLEVLKEVRSDSELVGVPVILLTAKGLTQDRIAGFDAGADAYLPKPFDPDELVTVIDNIIERRETLKADKVGVDDLKRDLDEIKYLLLEKGGGGVGNGWVQASNVFLAPDEREILELLCQGLMTKEIAGKTFLSTRRVEQLLTGMFKKADVKNRTELVRWAVASGRYQM
jgi:DNA-binding NarL/FixJ family response regulator